MICQAEVELAEQSGNGGGEDQLRQGHAYTGACAASEWQGPPHLQDQLEMNPRSCAPTEEPPCVCTDPFVWCEDLLGYPGQTVL